ncbi:hypothetical protein [Caulobacter sp. B11]|uniref:hypothetical protein n=1 Tax=Caulobacter sp. B11 TaxID=2048899 RepID=UPI0011807A0F|nr:hypothetical protein [Caulobacter sp. B11]
MSDALGRFLGYALVIGFAIWGLATWDSKIKSDKSKREIAYEMSISNNDELKKADERIDQLESEISDQEDRISELEGRLGVN